ncbi:TRNA arginine adenosine deaminase, putative isoform 1 [Theobroma cacao]|uniref:tRNA(adenine(34)) deaminase n=2 Tax=Theobroma cacao TaxID=3641 RepID=A0A061EC64_THECC|nr:TRNA arginine adenosine deaminase, putative isoform 1 [Theobroma cacao]
MYNSYSISSSVLSFRSNGSVSFSFNDYSSNLLNSSIEKTTSPCSSCCSCCGCCCATFATHALPISSSFLYGLRQSALVQCSPSRRLILPARRRYFLRFPSCDFDHAPSEVSTASFVMRKTKGRFRCMVSEENSARHWLGGVDAAEGMISLLSEEVDADCFSAEKNRTSYKIVEVEKRKNYDSECSSQKKEREQVEKTRSYVSQCNNGNKKRMQVEERGSHVNKHDWEKNENVGSGLLGSDSKHENESITIESREESKRKTERASALRAENRRGRTKSSSCSSYYSLSSSGDLESDTDLPDQEEQFVEESLSGHVTELIRNENSRTEGWVAEGFKKDNVGGSTVDWDLRKKSEKKLAEVSTEEIQSGAKSSQEYSRRVKNDESAYKKRSSSHEQLDDKGWEIRKQHSQTDNQVIGQSESRKKSQDVAEISKIHVSNAGATSQKLQFTGREANVKVSEIRDSQRLTESRMKIEEEDTTLVQSRSESRKKIWEEDTTMAQSSFQQTRKQHQQKGERIIGQLELRRKSECLSEINEAKNKKTSILQSETHKKKQDDTSSLYFTSNPETKKQGKDQKPPQRIESGKGLQAVTNISVIHADNIEMVTNSQTSSGKRLIEHESNLTSGLGLISDRSERHNGRVEQIKSRKENGKSVSSSWEEAEEASSFPSSLSLVSEAREQQLDVDVMGTEKRSTQAVLMPPESQVIAGGLQCDDSMTRISTQKASFETSESGSTSSYLHSTGRTTFAPHEPCKREMSETYGESINLTMCEDSLGSAQRLEESSLQFVGEFVEKARHDVLTSEVQQGNRSSDSNSAYNADKQGQDILGQYSKEELKMKKHDSRQSSKGSGAKGPSDEMWDVTDPSVQDLPEVEILQKTSTSEHAVVKRTGRSLWSLMADVIRLRWGSRAQTPSSGARSGGRTSPNESAGSETWFSGREPDENSEENLRRERGSMASEVITYQLGPGTQGEGDVSDSKRSTDKITQLEGNISPSSNMLDTGSASEGTSLTSQKEKHDGSSFVIASGKEMAQSSIQPLPARSIRRSPVVEGISETDRTDILGSGSIGVMERPLGARLTEASGSQVKDGELKQRKLQRVKQVPRDKFDEWEEAYTLEREQRKMDEMFMKEALLEAKKAADSWEVPVGAVLVQHGKIIARGRNLVEELRDSTAHAEMICIREASSTIRSWRLADTTLYVTLEPCPMCAGAILQARVDTLVWGAPNKLLGADGSWIRLFPDGRGGGNGSEPTDKPAAPVHPFHPKMTIRRGILASECADTMQQYFQLRRKNKEKNAERPPSPSCLPITSHPSKIITKMHDIFHVMFCL